ncbi:LuxR C-terminal-related transcriptional regulator [Mongoliitalea daihaiensis]|uniref:LuxR C-terminal-related transcriptional regulator n=1 Tax=Mongoliitalea daihaiensis TaxID=2782006 RepID=UPI001F1FDB12|nr:LuxR C-terminal-related transcriptional regulator [Mongoliitalea daihaiensis]UJP65691.1 PAS domain-containing protein [Mongoliitalea daihaiensis]
MKESLIQDLQRQDKYAVYFREWQEREFVPNSDEQQRLANLELTAQHIGLKEGLVIACFDYRELKLAFYTDNVEEITGYPASFLKNKGMEAGLGMIHPDDLPELFRFQKIVFDTWHTLTSKEKESFEWTYTVRWVHKDTKVVKWFFARVRPYLVDQNGNIVIDLHLIVELTTPPQTTSYDWSFSYTSKDGTKVLSTRTEPKINVNLTKKEKMVAKLLMEGFNSEEIAQKLYIAINTVYTHRKNILKKLGAKNTPEMLKILFANSLQ